METSPWAMGQRVGASAGVPGQDVGASLTMVSDYPQEAGLTGKEATASWGNERRKLGRHSPSLLPCFSQTWLETWDPLQAECAQWWRPEAWWPAAGPGWSGLRCRGGAVLSARPSVTTKQPGVRPGPQGFGGSLSGCSRVFSGTSLVGLQGEAAADGPQIYLTLGFCISRGSI